jgi:LysM repeat protein
MSGDLDRLLTDAAATPTRTVDPDALHARAQRARRRGRLATGLCAIVLLGVGTIAVLPDLSPPQRVDLAPADAPDDRGPIDAADSARPPDRPIAPLHLVTSHPRVASSGQTISLAVVNGSGEDFGYGADGLLQRWDGTDWAPAGFVVPARTGWESGGTVALPDGTGTVEVPAILYTAPSGGAGEPEWLTLPALDPGWYRLVRGDDTQTDDDAQARQVDDDQLATAVFEVLAADEPVQPALDVPGEDPYLGLDVAAVGPTGGPLDMVPSQGTDVAGRADGERAEGSAQLSRWDPDGWSAPQTTSVQLRPEQPLTSDQAVRVDIPPLDPGFYRVQIPAADGGQLTGYLWVNDALTNKRSTEHAQAPASEDAMPLTYTVQPGDTWSSIAEAVYGDARQFQALIDAHAGSAMPPAPGNVIGVPALE